MLTIEDGKVLADFKLTPNKFARLYSICVNFNKLMIGDTET